MTAASEQLLVGWRPPRDDGGSALTGYSMQWREAGGAWDAAVEVDDLEYTIGELVNERPYEVQVLALNEVGPSAAVSGSGVPAGVPDAPRNLVVTAGDEQLVVSWQAPENDHGAPVTTYQVQYRLVDDNNDDDDWVDVAGSVSPVTITGLADGESYQVRVQAKNATGWGPWVEGSGVPVGAPDLVGMLAVEALDGKLTVSWTAPEENGGATVAGYRVEYRVFRGTWTLYEFTENLEVTIDSLTNGVSYEVQVTAINEDGLYGEPATVTATPLGPSTPPQHLSVSTDPGTLRVSWAPPHNSGGYPVDNYKITISGGNLSSPLESYTVASVLSASITNGITDGHAYRVEVLAITRSPNNTYYDGEPAAVDSAVVGLPNAPRNLTVTVLGQRETSGVNSGKKLKATWDVPLGANVIEGYQVYWQEEGADVSVAPLTETEYTIDGLENGTEYTIWVTASNPHGTSPPSETVTGTPLTAGRQLAKWVAEHLVPKYEDDFPWLRFTVDRLQSREIPFQVVEGSAGTAPFSYSDSYSDTLAINIGVNVIRSEGVIVPRTGARLHDD